ncbi:Uncharacterised protein [uncultured archaeon]|nr:Uncharacterised protein [uncultured archaeon]
MVSGAHEAVVAHPGALLKVAIPIAVVVEIRPAAEHVPALMAEGSNGEFFLAAPHAGKHIKAGRHSTILHVYIIIMRPEFSQILSLSGINKAQSIDNAHFLRVELQKIHALFCGQVQSLLYQQIFDVILAVAGQSHRSQHHIGIIQLAIGHESKILAHGAEVAVFVIVLAVEQGINILTRNRALQILELNHHRQTPDLTLADSPPIQQSLL